MSEALKRNKSIGIRILLGIAGIAVGFFVQTMVLPMILKVLGLEVGIFPALTVLLGFVLMGYLVYSWAFDGRIAIKYYMLILVGIIMITSVMVVSYEQKQKQQKAELLAYLDEVSSREIKHLGAIEKIQSADMATYRAIQAQDEQAFLKSLDLGLVI